MNCHIHFIDSPLWNGPRWDQQAYSCRTEETQKIKWRKKGKWVCGVTGKAEDEACNARFFIQPCQKTLNDLSNLWEKVFTATLASLVVNWPVLIPLVHSHWNTGVEKRVFFPFILFEKQTDGCVAAYLVKWWKNKQLWLQFPTAVTGHFSLGNSYLIKIRQERQWSTVPGSTKNKLFPERWLLWLAPHLLMHSASN